MKLSIIIPTISRLSLSETIDSIRPQLLDGDEVMILRNDGAFGNAARQEAMHRAKGDILLFMDDDDVYLPDAFAFVRLHGRHGLPMMFKMERGYPYNDVLWNDPIARYGNISTQMFAVPNVPSKLGKWGDRYEGDCDFILSTLDKWGVDQLKWCDEVIAQWRRL